MFITDKEIARKVLNQSSKMIVLVEKELVELGQQLPQEEYNKCRHQVGYLIHTLCNVINDISLDHPDLKPEGFPVYRRKEEAEQ